MLDRPAWWSLGDGQSVYGDLIEVVDTSRGQRLRVRVWDSNGREMYFNQRHVLRVTFGEPVYACGRRLQEPRE
jgi:hypothetical protein